MNKKWILPFILSATTTIATAQSTPPKVSVTRWPQERHAAISLTFDDGINTDLDFAGPILKKHHLHRTFFVATRIGPWEARKAEWKLLARQGNELGNHTVHHPCLLAQITPHSQDYTPAMFEAEIRDAAREIAELVPSTRGLTFAYPCGNQSFGKPEDEVKNAALYLRYVSENSFGARAVGAGGAEDPDELNTLAVGALGSTEDKDFAALLGMAEPTIRTDGWGVYCFHGVGGDWLSITPEALDELAAYFERHQEIWTATFGDVLRYTQERKAASIQMEQSGETSIHFGMKWPMDKQIYDVPLTIKVETPAAWANVTATGDGISLNSRIIDRTKGAVMLVEVPSQTKKIKIERAPLGD